MWDDARTRLRDAKAIVILTGAGISAESGVPTFRGAGGLWKNFRPEDLATPSAFQRDPRLIWEWYEWRRSLVAQCQPNPAHHAIARLVAERGAMLITQNVDGLHAQASLPGSPPPLELHGSLFRVRCSRCTWSRDHRDAIDATNEKTLPRCPRCNALARPGVVWFGESLDPLILEAASAACTAADLCLVVGTSAVVHPAAGLARLTKSAGGTIIEVNPEPTPLTSYADISLRSSAVEAMSALG